MGTKQGGVQGGYEKLRRAFRLSGGGPTDENVGVVVHGCLAAGWKRVIGLVFLYFRRQKCLVSSLSKGGDRRELSVLCSNHAGARDSCKSKG